MGDKVLGVELGGGYINLALVRGGRKPVLLKLARVDVPGWEAGGDAPDAGAVAAALAKAVADERIKADAVSVCVDPAKTLLADMDLPFSKPSEMRQAVEFELMQTYQGIRQSHSISFVNYSPPDANLKGFAAACPNGVAEYLGQACKGLGIPLRYIDVGVNALVKAFRSFAGSGADSGDYVIADAGQAEARLCLVRDGQLVTSRKVTYSSDDMASDVASEMAGMLGFYGQGEGGAGPKVAYVTGERAKQLLARKESLPIPAETIAIQTVGGGGHDSNGFIRAIGTAIRVEGADRDINLLRAAEVKVKKERKLRAAVILLAAVALVGAAAVAYEMYRNNTLSEDVDRLESSLERFSDIEDLKDTMMLEEGFRQRVYELLSAATRGGEVHSDLLLLIAEVMPEGMFVTNYSATEDGTVSIAGSAEEKSAVVDFVAGLFLIGRFDDVRIVRIEANYSKENVFTDYGFQLELIH
ncbi:MAG: PilN domain-containing protein [Oscillospiraceae bacterium]|nr:PilN domain-containing protein [Oscillospiraceae bacterium]